MEGFKIFLYIILSLGWLFAGSYFTLVGILQSFDRMIYVGCGLGTFAAICIFIAALSAHDKPSRDLD